MKKLIINLMILFFISTSVFALDAIDLEHKQQTEALVKDAVSHVLKVGREQALKDFSDPKGTFSRGWLYIYAYNFKGKQDNYCVAHPYKHDFIGKNMDDINRHAFHELLTIMKMVAKNGGGWVDYYWENPDKNNEVGAKMGYVLPVPGEDFYVGSGYYLNTKTKTLL